MTNRAEMIDRTKSYLLTAEKSAEGFEYAGEAIADEWAAGSYDDCPDVHDRARLALDRIEAGGNARR